MRGCSWLPAGSLPVDEMGEQIGLTLAATSGDRAVAPPSENGRSVELFSGASVDMDGGRVDKVLLAGRAGEHMRRQPKRDQIMAAQGQHDVVAP